MTDLLQTELARAEQKGVIALNTKEPREAMQFARKADAIAMARRLGWPASSPFRTSVMGFQIWTLADEHLTMLTVRGVLRLLNERAEVSRHFRTRGAMV